MRPLRLRRVWLIAGWLLVAGVVAGSLLPGDAMDVGLPSDKVLHVGAYLALALWFGGVYRPGRYPQLALSLIALGLLLEIAQGQIAGRSMELADLAANVAGVVAGVLLAWRALGGWCLWVERLVLPDGSGA